MNHEDTRRNWAEREGEYSPEYYAHYGPDDTSESLRAILDGHVGRDEPVLEVGCSAGRHLAYLHDQGFADLTGVELNEDARAVLQEEYPALAEAGTFHWDAMESVVPEFDDGAFAAIYAVETLQHVHPDADWVFEELARVTETLLITVENEGHRKDDQAGEPVQGLGDPRRTDVRGELPLYHRDWRTVFEGLGFDQVQANERNRVVTRVFHAD